MLENDVFGAVGRWVEGEDDFVILGDAGKNWTDPPKELGDILLFLVDGNDDAEEHGTEHL
jgi:hypothetical protein